MADSPLLTKSKAFALEIIRVCNEILDIILPSRLSLNFLYKLLVFYC